MLEDTGGVNFDPREYVRGFSDAQIKAHLRACIDIVEELDPPLELAHDVFGIVQAMRATMISKAAILSEQQARQAVEDAGSKIVKVPPTLRIPRG